MNCCRVCLAEDKDKKMVSMFEQNSKIALEIFLLAGVKVIEILNGPALICDSCRKQLFEATNFRNKCKLSEGFYRENFFQLEENYLKRLINNENEFTSPKDSEEECHTFLQSTIDRTDNPKLKNERREEKKGSFYRKNDHSITQCELCLKNFTSLHSLKDHTRAIHQNIGTRDMYQCEFCNRLFKMKYYLS